MNATMIAPFTYTEIEKTVFSLEAHKAPRPDGFNGLFFQKNWDIVKNDVCDVVKSFQISGKLGEDINKTLVALIPTVLHPEAVSQLRPISCCNFVYKIISKILVCKLKPILGSLISPQQSAFVGGRLIQDNLVVAHEAFHFLKKKISNGRTGAALKLDMNKAYDKLDWSFLQRTLEAYGLCLTWVQWVMEMVTTVSYSYQVNGFNSNPIHPGRGLK